MYGRAAATCTHACTHTCAHITYIQQYIIHNGMMETQIHSRPGASHFEVFPRSTVCSLPAAKHSLFDPCNCFDHALFAARVGH